MRWLLDWQHFRPARVSRASRARSKRCVSFRASRRRRAHGNAISFRPAIARLRPGGARSPLADGRRRLGPPVAASRDHRRERSDEGRRVVPDERRAHHVLRARRCRLDGAAGHAATARRLASATTRATCSRIIERAGASFFPDIVRGVKHLNAEVEAALWELVAAGLVTADGFDSLRALIDPRRRAGQGTARAARPRHGTGRWSLLSPHPAADRTHVVESACRMLLRRYGVVFRELVRARSERAGLARAAHRVPASGRSRRSAGRPFRQWLRRRTVRGTDCGRVAAGAPPSADGGCRVHRLRGGSVESRRHRRCPASASRRSPEGLRHWLLVNGRCSFQDLMRPTLRASAASNS